MDTNVNEVAGKKKTKMKMRREKRCSRDDNPISLGGWLFARNSKAPAARKEERNEIHTMEMDLRA